MLDKPIQITEQNWSSGTAPVLSVFNWVYNHKDFIRESIESILIQKTTFQVEIIIHDDASNDGTKEIILEYQEKHPQLFRNILHDENQWSQGKSVMTPLFEKPRGEYIALTHGDDYWTDPYKLQKQVDFLEGNPEYSASMHRYKVIHENQPERAPYLQGLADDYSAGIEDVLSFGMDGTATLVFRRELIKPFFDSFHNFRNGDTSIFLVLASQGPIKYFSESMAVYRRNESGITNHNSFKAYNYFKETNKFLTFSDVYTNFNYSKVILESKLKIMDWIKQDYKTTYQKIHLFFLNKYFHFCLSILHRFQLNLNKKLKF